MSFTNSMNCTKSTNISFLLLAGGKGKRMGGIDKSALLYDSKMDFLEKILSETGYFKEIIISKNSPISEEKFSKAEKFLERKSDSFSRVRDYKVVSDIFEDAGPLAGLYSGMNVSSSPYIFVTTCDTPNITKDFIEYILGYCSSDHDAIIIKDNTGRVHPLCGIYKTSLLERVKEQIEKKDFKILNLFKDLNIKILDFKYTNFNLDFILYNFNCPEDFTDLNQRKNSDKKQKIFAVSGVKNSGKTTLITKIIEEIKKRKKSVAVIKHDGHEFSWEIPETDTWKFQKSGADASLIFSEKKFMMTVNRNSNNNNSDKKDGIDEKNLYPIESYLTYFEDYDYIILEGFKHSTYPKFEIVRKGNSIHSVAEKKNLLGLITDLGPFSNDISNGEELKIWDLNNLELSKELLDFLDHLS